MYQSYHTVSGGKRKKEGIFNADIKADVQGNKEKRYQDQGLQQSVRTYITESRGYIGRQGGIWCLMGGGKRGKEDLSLMLCRFV